MTKRQEGNAVNSLLRAEIERFVSEFRVSAKELFVDSTGKLVHGGEFGGYREEITKRYLRAFIPQRTAIGSGFVIDSRGSISTQCDIVIYDTSVTPFIQNDSLQRFFPIESVCAVGEVKSKLSMHGLHKALRKLSTIKSLRDGLWEPTYLYTSKPEAKETRRYTPEFDPLDQIVTFVICDSFSFDLKKRAKDINTCYSSEPPLRPQNLRHNMILSVQDGLIAYLHEGSVLFPFPNKAVVEINLESDEPSCQMRTRKLKSRVVIPQAGSIEHVRHFSTLLNVAVNTVSVLFPEMASYIKDQEDVTFIDIE
jgi:hypothetical protein